MGRITKLHTTMGIELTFMPPAMQDIINAINPEGDREPDEILSENAQNSMCKAYVGVLGKLLIERKAAFHDVSNDPGCVEVPTKPYTTLNGLAKACKAIWKCADHLGLVPRLESFNGGGAHVHTAILGKTREDRQQYVARMAVFANRNPWLSWAFLGVVDDINAEPIVWTKIVSGRQVTREQLTHRIDQYRNQIGTLTAELHEASNWESSWEQRWHIMQMDECRRLMNAAKLRLHRFVDNGLALTDFEMPNGKSLCMRHAPYGPSGTIEFRAFEMPDTCDELAKRINLCNAIVAHVRDQTYTSVAINTLFNKEQHDALTWRQRRDGFNAMLSDVGLDPADYKAERVQIALRMRYYRPKPSMVAPACTASMDAAIAGTHAALTGDDNYALAA